MYIIDLEDWHPGMDEDNEYLHKDGLDAENNNKTNNWASFDDL